MELLQVVPVKEAQRLAVVRLTGRRCRFGVAPGFTIWSLRPIGQGNNASAKAVNHVIINVLLPVAKAPLIHAKLGRPLPLLRPSASYLPTVAGAYRRHMIRAHSPDAPVARPSPQLPSPPLERPEHHRRARSPPPLDPARLALSAHGAQPPRSQPRQMCPGHRPLRHCSCSTDPTAPGPRRTPTPGVGHVPGIG
eukprot:scaffold110019_cov32-Tisochrysis_lutea.AAC.1